jgi:DNA-binding MarR family transcriptional regulator
VTSARPVRRFERARSLGYVVNLQARLFAQALHRRISPLGVVPGQFAQLLALYERDGRSQSELCREVRIEQATMARTLQRMERDGLIERRSDPEDRRRTLILLTPRARRIEAALKRAATEVNALATKSLSQRDLDRLWFGLHRTIENLESDLGMSQSAR